MVKNHAHGRLKAADKVKQTERQAADRDKLLCTRLLQTISLHSLCIFFYFFFSFLKENWESFPVETVVHINGLLLHRGKHTSGTSVRLLHWRVWKKSNVNLINVRSGTFCQRGRESRKGRKKKAALLPTHHPPSSGRDVVAELPFDGAVGGFPCHYAVSKLHLMLTHGR